MDNASAAEGPPPNWPWSWIEPRGVKNGDWAEEGPALSAIGALLADARQIMDNVLDKTRQMSPVAKHIVIGFTSYGLFGGSAGYLKGRNGYAVAVESTSSLQIIFALFRLAREPSTFKAFKSAEQPKITEPFGLPILTANEDFGAAGNTNTKQPTLVPDPKLYGYLRLLHSHALSYLFFHEIIHVVQGHIEFCRRAKYAALNLSRAEREVFLRKELRPLEFLADRDALRLGAMFILDSILSNQEIQKKRESALEHLTLWGIAAGVVALLYEHFSSESGTHPPAAHRAFFIRAAHIEFPGLDLSSSDIQGALNDGIEETIRGWDALGWPRDTRLPRDVDAFLKPIQDVDSRCKRPKGSPQQMPSPVSTSMANRTTQESKLAKPVFTTGLKTRQGFRSKR